MRSPSHTAPHLDFSITYKRGVELQMEIKIICRRVADDAICGDVTLLFCMGRLRNAQNFQTHVLSYCSVN